MIYPDRLGSNQLVLFRQLDSGATGGARGYVWGAVSTAFVGGFAGTLIFFSRCNLGLLKTTY